MTKYDKCPDTCMEYRSDGFIQLSTMDGGFVLASDTTGEDLLDIRGQYQLDAFTQDINEWEFEEDR